MYVSYCPKHKGVTTINALNFKIEINETNNIAACSVNLKQFYFL